jgi:hypothetical protein
MIDEYHTYQLEITPVNAKKRKRLELVHNGVEFGSN